MRIAVTGGSGRVGRTVIDHLLSNGHQAVNMDLVSGGPDRPNYTFVKLDTTDYEAFEQAMEGCEALIHLAAIPGPIRHKDFVVHNVNVVSSYNALQAAVNLGIKRVCQASSINAIGGVYSRWPKYDYFPVDEEHPTYNEDPYSLSKWICELQGDSIAQRYEDMVIASLRLHGVVDKKSISERWSRSTDTVARQLWGYTVSEAVARACLLSITADFSGHEAFYIVAPDTMMDQPSLDLKAQYFPDVEVRGDLGGNNGFFNCQKAERLLGWQHNIEE